MTATQSAKLHVQYKEKIQEYKGIYNGRQINEIFNDDTQNYPFYRLQLVVETF